MFKMSIARRAGSGRRSVLAVIKSNDQRFNIGRSRRRCRGPMFRSKLRDRCDSLETLSRRSNTTGLCIMVGVRGGNPGDLGRELTNDRPASRIERQDASGDHLGFGREGFLGSSRKDRALPTMVKTSFDFSPVAWVDGPLSGHWLSFS